MLYDAFEVQSDMARATRAWGHALQAGTEPWMRAGYGAPASWVSAAARMMMRAGLTHARPAYGIASVRVGNRETPVTEERVLATPFGTLLRFRKDIASEQPRVLVVAPLSGHFATLLRGTVRTLLADHDVYITDWHNARDVPVSAGRFGFDDYVAHLVQFLEAMGPGAHVVAVCQPCVQALAAAAVMAESRNAAHPASMTLMAGPVDTRVNPTKVNELATSRPIDWFEKNLIATVPRRHAGAGRRVYPGFMQVTAFMSMNAARHMHGHLDLYWHLADGEAAKAAQIETFYDEYFAVLDLPAEFYLETVRTVFQDATLAQNRLTYRGAPIDTRAIRKTALMTVEGERDDICAVGQTVAAHDLCTGLKPFRKRHHLQAGVGHYGVFSGRKWEAQTYPLVRSFIQANA
ncbi:MULTISPECIES: polyhydroxyalkanoate depolymerase [Methylobacterium]|jgi:poly(3-hydroxybutyrate) depolymerase|uniref:polyhydroxyalkanoate depolymerase n=1 Tax=Methylobacterium TaxID=407 RepID=UPI0008F11C74|nr:MULTISPECIES: polyhydroxyalkanoate depolymerase [Methylobacterium]MBZ6412065.1 polyhydroxyalkanoate depolymerase [Methylobacterium sp.]MBK3395855.1 polyhydroxyalkanoate depolymerase [Methylobacterium ajmalii]MBK3412152.1 polyhydroxyalkanoate depolymerase [Methylobacterium ajmalii]MBK3420383.1 polyhydroxyalkanoate depolymerase [Methylobacterium ajmalii]SFF13286.1 polyhydroxyalkanoate depolymerase, intracellular [Methylobacterium sp. yr596]